MQRALLLAILPMLLLLGSCNGRFDYRHRYKGDFAMQDSIVIPQVPSSIVEYYQGHVYQGDEGELVFDMGDGEARVLTVAYQGLKT